VYHRIKLWVEDETRIGLMPIHRKRITLPGVRPLISSEIKREYEYLYGLVEPLTGKSFMMELPNLEGELMELFMAECGQNGRRKFASCVNGQRFGTHDGKDNRSGEHHVHIFSAICP
jgi:hypothetical protein